MKAGRSAKSSVRHVTAPKDKILPYVHTYMIIALSEKRTYSTVTLGLIL